MLNNKHDIPELVIDKVIEQCNELRKENANVGYFSKAAKLRIAMDTLNEIKNDKTKK